MFPDLFLLVCIVMNAEVWSETKSALKIKGLIIVLTFNHQLVQSEQTGWEDLRVSLTELLESLRDCTENAAFFPHLNLSRENRKSQHFHQRV